ncbi:MAG: hypothetical protein P9L94_19040 [Candidatus Hinthialibacter antarcticus]|nr:hypothetical protein [Candidatus Hinthialibacter antarcticus]
MKITLRILLLFACISFLFNATAAPRIDLSSQSQWSALHDVSAFSQSEPGFAFECTGADPYIHTQPFSASSDDYKAMRIRLSASAGSQIQVFWISTDNPGYSEPFSARVELKPDGKPHEYVLSLAANPKWTGTITRLRLDPSDTMSKVTLHSFELIDRIGPRIEPIRFAPAAPFANLGEPLRVRARLRNAGDQDGSVIVKLIAPPEIEVIGAATRSVSIPPNQETYVEWRTASHQTIAAPLRCEINSGGPSMNTVARWFDAKVPGAFEMNADDWRARFVLADGGAQAIELSAKVGAQWRSAAWSPDLGTVKTQTHRGETHTLTVAGLKPVQSDASSIQFETKWRDKDGVHWRYSLEARRIKSPVDVLQFDVALQGDGGRLLYLSGPEFYPGERSFGRSKDLALLPGVEYLDRYAVSSSDEVARPPVRDHYRPHPYKITIPLMALTQDNLLISLLWPPKYPWSRNEQTLSPTFAVPNCFDEQNNHRFGVFAPSVPNYVLENADAAHEPYIIQPGETVRLQYAMYLTESNDPIDAIDAWTALYQRSELPQPMQPPRSYEDAIRVSREAYMTTCWDETKTGWGHCAGWAASPSGGMLALLDFDRFLTGDNDAALSQRIETVRNHILETQGEAGLASPAGCHVMFEEAAFYWGVVEQSLPGWKRAAQRLANAQDLDGSWGFGPNKPEQKDLGEAGEVVSGTIAPNAMRLLRYARISGDVNAAWTGFKALKALNALRVPRGSQGWECPLAAADVMVCGYAARANLDAYRITNQRAYLDEAVYWARAGLAFHYLWELDDRPLQRYATIPIFGTTFFTHSWRGVPVQWCGLVYSYALQELAPFDDRYDWRMIAEGIINSALWQQLTDGPYAGTLPDSYGDYCLTARGAYINPENIMTNLHALHGNSLDIETAFFEKAAPDAQRVSANAAISDPKRDGGKLSFSLSSTPGRTTSILIAPLPQKPESIYLNGEALQMKSDSDQSGWWLYQEDGKHLIITIKQQMQTDVIVVE